MSQKSNRNKRRGRVRDNARPAAAPAAGDRYQKFLPEWMRGNNAAIATRPPRPRRPRQARPAGGYTPGKFALND
jgi:hypothetical protein